MAEHSKATVERYLPEAFLFAILLTFVAYTLAFAFVEPAATVTGSAGFLETVTAFVSVYGTHAQNILLTGWYGGFWSLLGFAMQMTLILMTGHALAQADIVDRLLSWIAKLPSSEKGAAALVPVVAAMSSFIHWGLGLIVGAIFARKVAENIRGIDFPIIVAGAYSGFLVFHGGFSASIPLLLNTEGNFLIEAGILNSTISTGATIFTTANLVLVFLMTFVFLPGMFVLMYPKDDGKKTPIDPAELKAVSDGGEVPADEATSSATALQTGQELTYADKLEQSRLIALAIGIGGLLTVGIYYAVPLLEQGVMPWNNLNLNIVNFLFLFLGLILHRTPGAYIEAMKDAVENVWGIILQFPFYAGIMGIMGYAPEGSINLATQIAQGMVMMSPDGALPAIAFLTGGIVNLFVPSGGGEWSVIGETMIKAAKASDASIARISMAVAWGDAWTNMLQPFWAIPLLAISGLSVRDIMGYCVMILVGSGLFLIIGLTFLPM